MQENILRSEKCRFEAKESLKSSIESGKSRVQQIMLALTNAVTNLRSRFEATFSSLHDMMGTRYGEEITGIESLCLIARVAIEDCVSILKPLYLQPELNMGPKTIFTSSKSLDLTNPAIQDNYVLKETVV